MSDTFEFAGDHMRITEDAEGTASITFDDTGTGRRCGECSLCCKLQLATIVRFNSSDALLVFPPAFDRDGKWHEGRATINPNPPDGERLSRHEVKISPTPV
jgi:hypothetical protein